MTETGLDQIKEVLPSGLKGKKTGILVPCSKHHLRFCPYNRPFPLQGRLQNDRDFRSSARPFWTDAG